MAAGTASISYTVTNSCGSISTAEILTVNPLPVMPSVITRAGHECPGTGTLLNDATPGGAWSSSNVAVATVNATGMVTGLSSGTAVISYTETNGCGNAFVTKVFTVDPLPIADSIPGVPKVCAGSVTLLSDMPMGGIWLSDNNSIAIVAPTGVVTGVTPGTTTIRYIAENSCGSSAAATITVTVNQLPIATSNRKYQSVRWRYDQVVKRGKRRGVEQQQPFDRYCKWIGGCYRSIYWQGSHLADAGGASRSATSTATETADRLAPIARPSLQVRLSRARDPIASLAPRARLKPKTGSEHTSGRPRPTTRTWYRPRKRREAHPGLPALAC